MASWSDQLSNEQAAAASYGGSHARLLAGPGTGKTYTMAGRVAYLISERGVPASEILVLTFTRLATRQLRETIQERIKSYSTDMPYISTLHAFALRQLQSNAAVITTLPQPLRIADDWEERQIIQEEFKTLLNRNIKNINQGFELLSADWQQLNEDTGQRGGSAPDAPFVGTWEEHRRIYGYTLRAELVYQLKRAMQQVPQFTLESRFRHVLIDEYQDLNPCDLAIAKALTINGASLLACGDDDQSIYGFRHADPSGIRNFIDDFGGAGDLVLTECRRCGSAILAAALWVAEQDANRVGKKLHALPNSDAGEVHILGFQDGLAEAKGVAALCHDLIASGTKPKEILILVRSDRNGIMSKPVRQALCSQGIEVVASSETWNVVEEKPGRKLVSMLRLIANPRDDLAWRSRMELSDGMGPSTFRPVYNFAAEQGIRFSEALMRLDEFEDSVPAITRSKLSSLVSSTLEALNGWAEALGQRNNGSEETREDLLTLVRDVARSEIIEEDGRVTVVSWF